MASIDLEKWTKKIYDWFDEIIGCQFNPETVHEKTVLTTQVCSSFFQQKAHFVQVFSVYFLIFFSPGVGSSCTSLFNM